MAAAGEPYVVDDILGFLKIMSDGTVIRSNVLPILPFPIKFPENTSIEWKDLVFHPIHSLGVRVYRPVKAPPGTKFPLITMFHGGGFCVGSRTWGTIHATCSRLSAEVCALVLSFDYRLAPEHLLPAAVEDAEAALLWIKSQCTGPNIDPWFAESADFTRVFISGDSTGGVLTHHMAVKFGTKGLNPVQIRGFILLVPSMDGKEPTQSEVDCPEDALVTRFIWDRYVRLSLPPGADKDHPVFNPFGPQSPSLENVDMGPLLVVSTDGAMFIDRNKMYVKRLKEMGKKVELVEIAGQDHAFFTTRPLSEATGEVIRVFRQFMDRTGNGSC